MPAKKKEAPKDNNIDKLFKKVDELAKQMDVLQVDVKDMAIELLKVTKEHNEKLSLMKRIKNRLGL